MFLTSLSMKPSELMSSLGNEAISHVLKSILDALMWNKSVPYIHTYSKPLHFWTLFKCFFTCGDTYFPGNIFCSDIFEFKMLTKCHNLNTYWACLICKQWTGKVVDICPPKQSHSCQLWKIISPQISIQHMIDCAESVLNSSKVWKQTRNNNNLYFILYYIYCLVPLDVGETWLIWLWLLKILAQ